MEVLAVVLFVAMVYGAYRYDKARKAKPQDPVAPRPVPNRPPKDLDEIEKHEK